MTTPDPKILNKVQALLTQAEHPSTGDAEREAFLARADEMMVKYAIDAALLAATQKPNERRKPITEDVRLFEPSEHSLRFRTILREIARTCRVRAALRSNGTVVLAGFSDDVAYTQMLFHSIHLSFLAALSPTWEQRREFDDNVYRLKEAGIKWVSIANLANRNGEDVPWPDGGRLIRAYKRQCKVLGVEPTNHTQRHEAYRNSYAEAFTGRICERLEIMRAAATQAAASTTGAEVALRDASQDIDDLWYEMFPHTRPLSDEEMAAAVAKYEEEQRLEQEKHDAWWASLTDAQRAKEQEKIERKRLRDAEADERYWRDQDKRTDSTGARRGRAAADKVDLIRKDAVDTTQKGEIQ